MTAWRFRITVPAHVGRAAKSATLTISTNDPVSADENGERVRHRAAVVCLRAAGLRRSRRGGGSDLRLRRPPAITPSTRAGRYLGVVWRTPDLRHSGARRVHVLSGPAGRAVRRRAAVSPRHAASSAPAASFKTANLRSEASAGALSHATLTFDCAHAGDAVRALRRERPARDRRRDAAGNGRRAGPLGQPVIATEQILHTIDQLRRIDSAANRPPTGRSMGTSVYLHRHAPGVGDTARWSDPVLAACCSRTWRSLPAFDVNESFLGPNAVGTFTFGVTLGRWSQAHRLLESRQPARHAAAARPLRAVRARALRTAGGQPGFDPEPARHPRRHCAR